MKTVLKTCSRCHEAKGVGDFGRDKSKSDGFNTRCRVCVTATNLVYRSTARGKAKNIAASRAVRSTPEGRAKANAASRARYSTPEGKAKHNAAALMWRKANLSKHNATALAWTKNNPDKHAAGTMKHKTAKLRQQPSWADLGAIALIYAKAAEMTRVTGTQHQVDHKVPLRGKTVSGLHVDYNLEVITTTANRVKGNRSWKNSWA